MKPIIVAVVNDTHVNSSVALRPPSFQHDDLWISVVSKYQQWLWDNWLDYVATVKRMARGCKVVVVGNGDLLDVDAKKRSTQFFTGNHAEVVNMAYDVLKPLLSLADRNWQLRGTEAHEGVNGEYARQLAEKCGAEFYEGTQLPQAARLNIGGVLFEFAHHAAGGFRRASASAGSITRLAENTVIEYAGRRERVPDLVLRGHVHKFADSGDSVPACRAITNGAWQLHTAHSHRAGYGQSLSQIGATIIRCENGAYEVTRKKYEPQRAATVNYN